MIMGVLETAEKFGDECEFGVISKAKLKLFEEGNGGCSGVEFLSFLGG